MSPFRVALSAAFAIGLVGSGLAADEAVDLELMLAADVSSSISIDEIALQRRGFADALTAPETLRAIAAGGRGRIAVAYLEWAGLDYRSLVVGWTRIAGERDARRFATAIVEAPITGGKGTSISRAIRFATRQFAGNGFAGARRVIDISGDGPNNVGGAVVAARDAAVAAGITINGLPIIGERPDAFGIADIDAYYRTCVIGGPGAFIVTARGLNAFAAAVRRKLLHEVAFRTPTPSPRLWRASTAPPRCDIGERLLEAWHGDLTRPRLD